MRYAILGTDLDLESDNHEAAAHRARDILRTYALVDLTVVEPNGYEHLVPTGIPTETGNSDVSTLVGKKHLLATFCNSVRDALLSHADQWPTEWDGHELRLLLATAFEQEVTRIMRDDRKRKRAFEHEWMIRNLY